MVLSLKKIDTLYEVWVLHENSEFPWKLIISRRRLKGCRKNSARLSGVPYYKPLALRFNYEKLHVEEAFNFSQLLRVVNGGNSSHFAQDKTD